MRLPKHVEQAILSKPGVKVTPHAKKRKRSAKKMVEPSVTFADGKLVATLPVYTVSEINQRGWRARHRRNVEARRIVNEALGRPTISLSTFRDAFLAGKVLRVKFVRMGGRKLDRSNLPTATKATEDAVADLLLINDGSDQWDVSFAQEPGGPIGVRIEMEVTP